MKNIKCVVWDLDNTIWDGVILEDSIVTLKPGITKILETLDSRGILHSIASKNNYEDAMNQLVKFKIDHYFLYPQIGWNAKSESIKIIKEKLNIGLDTILFVDDQEFELAEVGITLPDVSTLNSNAYQEMVKMEKLNPSILTVDSKRRRIMYLEDQKRKDYEENYKGPSSDFMASLHMRFIISAAREEDLLRAEELTVRTNQLNSTGIQYSYEELKAMLSSPKHQLWICELTDIYGSYGKIGFALVELEDTAMIIKLLLMSCRTMSRGVGTVLLSFLMKQAKEAKKHLKAEFIRTSRNRQMLVTYQFSNFKETEQVGDRVILENDLSIIQDFPPYVEVEVIDKEVIKAVI